MLAGILLRLRFDAKLRNRDNSDKGSVLWWLEKPDYTWEYSVGITKEGDEVVCSIYKPL